MGPPLDCEDKKWHYRLRRAAEIMTCSGRSGNVILLQEIGVYIKFNDFSIFIELLKKEVTF